MQEQELDCSPAVKMLIERMQTHPEDFMYGGKLYRMTEQAQMSARDKKAYNAAHDLYLLEPQLMARVLEALMAPPEEEEETVKYKAQGRYGVGITDHQLQNGTFLDKNLRVGVYNPSTQTTPIYNRALDLERIERDN